jgi:hypothetical protein
VSALQHELEERDRWKVELARMAGRPAPTSRMSLAELQADIARR